MPRTGQRFTLSLRIFSSRAAAIYEDRADLPGWKNCPFAFQATVQNRLELPTGNTANKGKARLRSMADPIVDSGTA